MSEGYNNKGDSTGWKSGFKRPSVEELISNSRSQIDVAIDDYIRNAVNTSINEEIEECAKLAITCPEIAEAIRKRKTPLYYLSFKL